MIVPPLTIRSLGRRVLGEHDVLARRPRCRLRVAVRQREAGLRAPAARPAAWVMFDQLRRLRVAAEAEPPAADQRRAGPARRSRRRSRSGRAGCPSAGGSCAEPGASPVRGGRRPGLRRAAAAGPGRLGDLAGQPGPGGALVRVDRRTIVVVGAARPGAAAPCRRWRCRGRRGPPAPRPSSAPASVGRAPGSRRVARATSSSSTGGRPATIADGGGTSRSTCCQATSTGPVAVVGHPAGEHLEQHDARRE